jgi:two-component system CitB family sensor kinase
VKVPVFDADGEVMGQVSVGILEAELWKDFWADASWMVAALGVATVIGVMASTGIARMVRRRIYGLEPEEIRGLLETREATLHGIREGLVALDEEGRVTLCNDAAATLLGLAAPEEAAGRRLGDLVDADLSELLADRSDAPSPQHLVLAGERVLVASAAAIRVDGRDIGSVVILMDRTELDRALQQLAGAQSMAEGLRAHQHEFANTLHTLGGLLELGEAATALRLIERAGDGGAISVLDAHSGIHDIEVSALVLAKRSWAKERGVTVTVADDAVLPEGAVRSSDLVTIVGNLLDNAIDAVGTGGRVELEVRTSPTALAIAVEDDGPGVSPAERDAVFQLGYTTKPGDRMRTAEGQRGYGLTLVARAVERLGGEIRIDDGARGGARFLVLLPRAGAEQQDAPELWTVRG